MKYRPLVSSVKRAARFGKLERKVGPSNSGDRINVFKISLKKNLLGAAGWGTGNNGNRYMISKLSTY